MRQTVSATPRVSILRENTSTAFRSSTTDPFHSLRKRRIIATAGGSYDVPAFRLALSHPAAFATSSRIPNATPQTVPHEAAMVADLGRGQRARAAYARSYSGDAIGTSPGVFPMEGLLIFAGIVVRDRNWGRSPD